jgi:hypothetical protein
VASRKPGLTKRDARLLDRIRRDLSSPDTRGYVRWYDAEELVRMIDRLLAQVRPEGEGE